MSCRILKTADLARYCQVNPKTVHIWADKGKIMFFRTPGGHRRYRATDVEVFLRTYGYVVPAELHNEEGST